MRNMLEQMNALESGFVLLRCKNGQVMKGLLTNDYPPDERDDPDNPFVLRDIHFVSFNEWVTTCERLAHNPNGRYDSATFVDTQRGLALSHNDVREIHAWVDDPSNEYKCPLDDFRLECMQVACRAVESKCNVFERDNDEGCPENERHFNLASRAFLAVLRDKDGFTFDVIGKHASAKPYIWALIQRLTGGQIHESLRPTNDEISFWVEKQE